MTYGLFIKEKREEAGIKAVEVARALDISNTYLSDVENGRRAPFKKERNDILVSLLKLNKEDRALLYDLAAKELNECPQDILRKLIYTKEGRSFIQYLRNTENLNYV